MTGSPSHARFAKTRWSLVQRAAGPAGRAALDELCAGYWRPLYAWLRRDGHDEQDAADLCQGFLASLLERESLAVPTESRFRSYLLGALRNYVANDRRRDAALRRGGHLERVDSAAGEELFAQLPGEELSPEQAYERAYALELLGRAMRKLEQEFSARDRTERFESLRPLLDGRADGAEAGGYEAAAQRLGIAVGAVRVAVHRARQRLGELVREEIAETVESAAELEVEIAALREALG